MISICQRLFLQLRKGTQDSNAATDQLSAILFGREGDLGFWLICSE